MFFWKSTTYIKTINFLCHKFFDIYVERHYMLHTHSLSNSSRGPGTDSPQVTPVIITLVSIKGDGVQVFTEYEGVSCK